MSTLNYKVKEVGSSLMYYVESPSGERVTAYGALHAAEYACVHLNKMQAELDKAVELLGKLAAIPLGVLDGLYADEILGARAYLSTLNPQPDVRHP